MKNKMKLSILLLMIIGIANISLNHVEKINFAWNLSGIILAAYADTEECVAGVNQCKTAIECTDCETHTNLCCVGSDDCFSTSNYVQCDGEATYCPGNYGIPCP
jgi:hypothetical protein